MFEPWKGLKKKKNWECKTTLSATVNNIPKTTPSCLHSLQVPRGEREPAIVRVNISVTAFITTWTHNSQHTDPSW